MEKEDEFARIVARLLARKRIKQISIKGLQNNGCWTEVH